MARLWHGVKRGPRSSRSGIEGRVRSGDSRLLSELLPSPGATAVRWADPVGGRCSRTVDATSSGSGAYARIWGTATAGTVPCTDRGVRSGRLGRLQNAGLQGRLRARSAEPESPEIRTASGNAHVPGLGVWKPPPTAERTGPGSLIERGACAGCSLGGSPIKPPAVCRRYLIPPGGRAGSDDSRFLSGLSDSLPVGVLPGQLEVAPGVDGG